MDSTFLSSFIDLKGTLGYEVTTKPKQTSLLGNWLMWAVLAGLNF